MAAHAQQWRDVTSDRLRWGPCLTPVANGTASAACAPGGRRRPTGGPGTEETPLTGGPHVSAIFQFQKTSKITFPHKKNRYKVRENLRKFMEVGNDIWNTFHNLHFFQIFTDFELIKRFRVKFRLTRFVVILAHGSTHCNSTRTPLWIRSSP
jgi:hypothetical protein